MQNEKTMELLDHLHEWVKTQQEETFWEYAKRVNLRIMLLDLPQEQNNTFIHEIVCLVKMAQMQAFRDGLKQGREEERQQNDSAEVPPLSNASAHRRPTGKPY